MVSELPTNWVGPDRSCQLLPTLSPTPVMLIGRPFHAGCVETKATIVDAPLELKGLERCAVLRVPSKYPSVLTTAGESPRTVMPTSAVLLVVVPSLPQNLSESVPT